MVASDKFCIANVYAALIYSARSFNNILRLHFSNCFPIYGEVNRKL